MGRITPFLWFDGQAEEAARFYCSIFPNARILTGAAAGEAKPGSVTVVGFELDGQRFTALNGGPHYTFTPAVSFVVDCQTQAEVDHYWDALCEGGEPQRCGWLKDRFGLSWQIVPRQLPEYLGDPDPARSGRVMAAMMTMSRIDIDGLRRAYEG